MTVSISPVITGVALSVIGAFAWASHYLFVQPGIDSDRVTNAVFVAILYNLVEYVPIVFVLNYPDFGLTWKLAMMFVLAGLGNGLFGRLFQFMSTDRVGASRTLPTVASAGLFSTLLAVLVLHETLMLPHFAGIVFIVLGMMVTSWETAHDPEGNSSVRAMGPSLLFLLVSAFFYGIEPILVKFGLGDGTPYLVGMAIMLVSAFVGFFGYRLAFGSVPVRTVRTDPSLKWYVGAGLSRVSRL